MAFWATAEKKRYKKVKEEGCVVTVSAEVPPAEFEETLQNVFVQMQAQARLPGFRPGKVPLDIIKKQFADDARRRAVEASLRKALPEVIKEFDLHPVSTPTVSDMKFEAGKPLVFQLSVEVAPKFEVKDYKKIPVVKKSHAPADADVAQRIEEVRQGNARLEKAAGEAVGGTDYVVVDYEGAVDGKPLEGSKGTNELVDMSAPQTVAGLSEGILGAKRGETREIDVDLQGKKAKFKVTIKEIKTKVVPALDDEFAKDLGFASVAELKDKVKEMMTREGEQKADRELREQLDGHLLKAHPIQLPPSLVEAQIDSMLERIKRDWTASGRPWPEKDDEKLRGKMRPQAESDIRLSYIYQAIAKKENIAATEEDLKAELEKNLGSVPDAEKDEIRKFFESHKDDIASVLKERKVIAYLKDNAKPKEG